MTIIETIKSDMPATAAKLDEAIILGHHAVLTDSKTATIEDYRWRRGGTRGNRVALDTSGRTWFLMTDKSRGIEGYRI